MDIRVEPTVTWPIVTTTYRWRPELAEYSGMSWLDVPLKTGSIELGTPDFRGYQNMGIQNLGVG